MFLNSLVISKLQNQNFSIFTFFSTYYIGWKKKIVSSGKRNLFKLKFQITFLIDDMSVTVFPQ